MKKTFFNYVLIAVLFITSISCSKDDLNESDTIRQEIDLTENVKGIVVGNGFKVTVSKSDSNNAYIDYSESLEGRIIAKIEDGYIYLGITGDLKIKNGYPVIQANISISELELIEISSGSSVEMSGNFNGDKCTIKMKETSILTGFNYTGESMDINLSSSSECEMSGNVDSATVFAKEGSSLDMINVMTQILDVNLSAASSAKVTVLEKITGKLSSACNLEYKGNADISEVDVDSTSNIKKLQ